MKTLVNEVKYSWCYASALCYRKRLRPNYAKYNATVEIIKPVSVSAKFSQQA